MRKPCQSKRLRINMSGNETILPGGKGVWIPIDHGVSDYPVEGLEDLDSLIKTLAESGVDAIVAHKGVVSKYGHLHEGHMIAHLSVSTRHSGKHNSDKVLVGTVEEVVSRGACGVSVQVNMGSKYEHKMIERLGMISCDTHKFGVPLLGMIYPRGENLKIMENDDTNASAHAARLAFELGCDVVKTKWTGDPISFAKVCKSVPIPVLIAGGPYDSDIDTMLDIVKQSIDAGGSGVCMGRHVFSHSNPGAVVTALKAIVHEGFSVSEAKLKSGL